MRAAVPIPLRRRYDYSGPAVCVYRSQAPYGLGRSSAGATSWALSTCPPYVAAKIRQEIAASKYSAVFICKIWKKCIFHLLWRPLQRGTAAFAVGTHPIVVRLRQRWERKAESTLVSFSFFEKNAAPPPSVAPRARVNRCAAAFFFFFSAFFFLLFLLCNFSFSFSFRFLFFCFCYLHCK